MLLLYAGYSDQATVECFQALLPRQSGIHYAHRAHSVAMIKHSMTIVQAAVRHLNSGQVPVLTADQPLFALAKQIHGLGQINLEKASF